MRESKKLKILSIAFTLIVCFAGIGAVVYADNFEARLDTRSWFWSEELAHEEELKVQEQSIGGMIVGMLVGVVIATNVLPMIANQTAVLEKDDAGDLDTNEEGLIGLWVPLIIIGVMMAIVSAVI